MSNTFSSNEPFFKDKDSTINKDNLTGVYNRETIFEYIEYLLNNKRPFSMMMCDIDNFKYVNDNHGHIVGDKVLIKSSANLERLMDQYGAVGRFGGDEFVVVVPDIVEYNDIWKVCRKITLGSNSLIIDELNGANISFTVGMSRYPIDGEEVNDILGKADKALYRGKQKGRNCFIIYLHEKHANIVLSDSSAVAHSSTDMHAKIFNMLSYSNNLYLNIEHLVSFLSSNLMIDHLCVQSYNKILTSTVHNLAYSKNFDFVPTMYLENNLNSIGVCILNNLNSLKAIGQNDMTECLEKQGITATAVVKIEAYGKTYGFLRADSSNPDGRIWQNSDIDLFVVFARLLGTILYYKNINLDDLSEKNLLDV